VLREGRDHIGRPGFRTREIPLVTTLLDAAIDRVAALAERYHQRWRVEPSLAQLNTRLQMGVLHGQTGPGVLKALTVFAIGYTLVRMVRCPSATRPHIGGARISFVDALRWLSAPSTGMP
jgi:hypothetical protein